MSERDRVIHQLSNGRWIVAHWIESAGQWHAPMNAHERRVTGAHTYFARSLEKLGVHSYAHRKGAVVFARKHYQKDIR
jgi:hypothetical protein